MNFFRLDRILGAKCTYNILLGQRANGKSYAVKEECVKEAFLGMGELIYLRRWAVELKEQDVIDYFADCPVKDITGGQYDIITVHRARIYLASITEDGQVVRGLCIGRTAALTNATHLKSVIKRGAYKNIIYEEFCTKDGFIPLEPDKLQQFVATVFGVQYSGRIWLIGNTVSRVNPYFAKWQLKNLKKMNPGDIDIYRFKDGDTEITIAVEFCSSLDVPSNMFFGDVAKNITTGVWETESMPTVPDEFGKFKVLYQVGYKHTDFFFILKLIQNKAKQLLIFCAPAEAEDLDKVKRKVQDNVSGDPWTTQFLIPLTKGDMIIQDLYKRGKIVYANNLTGSDFSAIIKSRRGL